MRNLIQFATTFGIALTEADTEQLGFDVEKSEFMEYFNIKDSHTAPKGFDPMDNIDYMALDEEKEIKDKLNIKKAKTKGVVKKVDEAKDDEKMKKAEAKAKAKPKAEKAEKPKKEAKPKAGKAEKEPKVKKTANWKKAASLTHLGLHISQILPFTEGAKDVTIYTDYRKALNQKDWASGVYNQLKDHERAEIDALLKEGKNLPITETEMEVKAKERARKGAEKALKKSKKEDEKEA